MPVFYNEKTGRASHNVNDVIDWHDLEFDPEGFNNYLDFGYSVLEQTPVRHVKFLRHSSRLWINDEGQLSVEYLNDPVDRLLDWRPSETDILDLIESKIRGWERSTTGEIIIPTSGGYDSRLLNVFIEDKSRVRSFTYGVSENQAESFEVAYARVLSQILGTKWEQVPLGDYHSYFDVWDKLFGVSTHAHGMYQIEFYSEIASHVVGGSHVLSGIIGDAWSGGVKVPAVTTLGGIRGLSYSHGLHADSTQSRIHTEDALLQRYFEEGRERLCDSRMRIVEAMRFKIILLSYLMSVPLSFGFKPWSPFLDIEVAMAMLNVPQARRQGRVWQRQFFQKQGVDLEALDMRASRENSLNHQAMLRVPLRPLDIGLLAEVIEPAYVHWINRETVPQITPSDRAESFLKIPKVGHVLRSLGLRSRRLPAYCGYLTLKPIESLLRRRTQV